MEWSIQKSKVCWLGFSGFIGTLDCLEGSSHLRRGLVVLWGGWGERKRQRAFSLFPLSPAHFLFFRLLLSLFLWGYPAGASAEERVKGGYDR